MQEHLGCKTGATIKEKVAGNQNSDTVSEAAKNECLHTINCN